MALLLVALWIPSRAAQPPRSPAIRLFDLTTAHGIVDEKPFQPARVFAPDDIIYLWYAAEDCAIGTTIESIWSYLETDPPFRLGEGTVTVDRVGDWGQFNFKLAEGKRWPIGRYRIELRVGDVLVAETQFAVTARTTVQRATAGVSNAADIR